MLPTPAAKDPYANVAPVLRSSFVSCRLAALAAVFAAGCGFRAPSGGSGDGGPLPDTPDPPLIDAPTVPCMQRWLTDMVAFGAPSHLTVLGSGAVERDPFVTPDEKTIYFSTNRSGTQDFDIFTATRGSPSAPFGAPQRNDDISSSALDSRFTMSADGLTGIVASTRTGSGAEGGSDLWISTRTNTSAPFNNFDRSAGLANVDTGGEELDPELSADGLRIYLAIENNPQRIGVASRSALSSSFGNAQQIDELFSGAGDADPTLSPDELVIVYSSRRAGGGGNVDLWYATRQDKDDPFGMPRRVPDVNGNAAEGDPALSPDGCRLYFASDRVGSYEIYVAAMR